MKKKLHRIAFALVALCTLLSVGTLAGGKSKQVTFHTDVMVGDTLVKKGNYEVTFDDQTSVLTIKRGSAVVAKASARMEEAGSKSKTSFIYRTWKNEKADEVLSSVKFGGASAVIGKDSTAATVSTPAAAGGQH